MACEKELLFMERILEKCRIPMLTVDPYAPCEDGIDGGIRKMIGVDETYETDFYDEFRKAKKATIYKMTDVFFCSYVFFLLPDEKKRTVVLIGPYLSAELTYEQLAEQAEIHGISPELLKLLEKYYGGITVNSGYSMLSAAIDTIAEIMWGDNFDVVDINQQSAGENAVSYTWEDSKLFEETDWNMQMVEERYIHENELIQAVSLGQIHKMEELMSNFGKLSFERRHADPVRNLKNYCIIMNTLLRKAAENGGVHPLYLDRISSVFANRIEALTSTEGVEKLQVDMYTDYCNLVKRHSTGQYSPTVQKTIMHINFGLSGDLSLNTLSKAQNVNASYLSSLFKKETGVTVTDYVNQKRVRRASRLLATTKLQVQTVAQHCGVSDVNYFSKVFKKYTGKTPKEYRKIHQPGVD